MEYSRGLHKSAVIIYMIERVIIQVIRRLKANCRLRIASAMTLCSLLYGLPPTYAASNLFEPGSYEQLARAEQVFFGKPNTTNSYFRRLDLLEVGIFGRVRSGSAEKRFDRISNALGLDAMNYGTARPPGDLTKGLANHESQENAANAEMSTLPVTSAVSGSESKLDSQSETSLSAAKHADLKSTSVGNIQEQQDSSNVASKSDFAAKPSISAAFNSASGATSNLANKVPTNAMKAKAAPAVKPGRSAILSKETPKLEPIAHKATDNADRRIKRSVPGTPTEIAHDKTKEVEELFKKGISDFREKHYADAQICFKKILAIDPRNVDAYYNLGSLSETKHDYVDALTYYRAALATKPADSDFKSAVHAMEDELRKQHGVTVTASEHRSTNSTDATSFINDDGKNNSKHDLAKNSGRGSGTSGSHIADVGSSTSHVADVGSTSAPEVKTTKHFHCRPRKMEHLRHLLR
jgi:tetratricopeptide (TPR) repeat protein